MTDRRRFLKSAALLGLGLCLPAKAWARTAAQPKSLKLYHTHTGETLQRVFWADGRYLPDALADISRVLRDHRTNEVAPIAPELLSLLERIATLLGSGAAALHVISGYRSPHTNQMLVEHSDGVAKRSLHMDGKAIDIRIPGRDLTDLRNAALSLRSGGVGFYPRSQFVHVDTGRVRSW